MNVFRLSRVKNALMVSLDNAFSSSFSDETEELCIDDDDDSDVFEVDVEGGTLHDAPPRCNKPGFFLKNDDLIFQFNDDDDDDAVTKQPILELPS